MKCWKCGKDLAAGADKCLFCGASMNRILPTTPTGKAMRTLYDRMGMQEVLSKKLYLTTALGDLLQDSQKLRNHLGMAMDSGMGAVYLTQIKTEGKPTSAFRAKVKRILTEDAGLSDKIALELMGYMDEMIGWHAGSDAQQKNPTGGREQPRTPGGKQSQSQHAELEKLKAEAAQESNRILALQQKLQPLKYTQMLQKEATDIYDQLSSLNRSLLDMMNNINRNLNQPLPDPGAVASARAVLRLARSKIDPLEQRTYRLRQTAVTQARTAGKKESGEAGVLGFLFLIICAVVALIFFPTMLPVIGLVLAGWFVFLVLASIFKKK